MAIYSRSAVVGVKPFDAQELDDLWQAIDSSVSSGDENEACSLVDDLKCSVLSATSPTNSAAMDSTSNRDKNSDSSSSGGKSSCRSSSSSPPPAALKRTPRKFTPVQIDMRRKRNRDSMRRVRQRKQVEVDHLRCQMELLQEKLEELRIVREQTGASSPSSQPSDSAPNSQLTRRSRSNVEVQELLEAIKALQYEQVCLHNAVLNHQQVSASLVQIIDESKSLNFRNESVYADLYQLDDEFQWVNAVLPLLPPLSKAHVYDLVRESYLDLVQHFKVADAKLPSAHSVLGWSDKRAVNGCWADFLFSKDFPHEDMDALAAKTWTILTYTNQQDGFQSQGLHLKVLDKLNDDTLIMARNTFFPLENKYYSSIYVLLRMETPDGYVIGGCTISPLPEYEGRLDDALGENRSYSHMFYGLIFDRLQGSSVSSIPASLASPLSSPTKADQSSSEARRGGNVKYGGRVGNGSELMAQTWAMDVLLAVLRWESSCIKPLYRLST